MAILTPRDTRAWHRLAGRVAEAIEPGLGAQVLANRVRSPGPVWTLEPVGSALARARRFAARMPPGIIVRTDVAAFYPSVTPTVLYTTLGRIGAATEDARAAANMLDGWGSKGHPGLPIGPSGSAVLANAVLAEVDAALEGVAFLRWVDDYLIALRTESGVSRLLQRLDEALDNLGLLRSQPKTQVTDQSASWPGKGTSGPP